MEPRFTIDGSPQLEQHLAQTCRQVVEGLRRLVPSGKIDGIVLAGGYGRGQGGVFKTQNGDRPYNDLEFYVFLKGNPALNERSFGGSMNRFAEQLSPSAGLHVEFKIDSIERLRRGSITMFSYDLLTGHRILSGSPTLFDGCEHHRAAEQIPHSEATRLLFNRCSGLLLVKELLRNSALNPEQVDFVGRNLAKARLAFGDALLTAFNQYHWSVLERRRRLTTFAPPQPLGWIQPIRQHYEAAVQFKLHPRAFAETVDAFRTQQDQCAAVGRELWLWLESRRLQRPFESPHQYAFYHGRKCHETAWARNLLLNLRTFGLGAALEPLARRYPRERLFNALALLLWNGEVQHDPSVQRHLRRQLHSNASDWNGFVAAYKQIWPRYG